MNLKLTQKWKKGWFSGSSFAYIHDIQLDCDETDRRLLVVGESYYRGSVRLGDTIRTGPRREHIREARRDAERLAKELLLDIRDGTAAMMLKYNIVEDN
jgi:hypothetical protein